MPRPLRNTDPENYHLVTVRTEEARIWMVPGGELNRTIGGIIARYQELTGIIIYAFCILGNHLHMLLSAPEQNLDRFMENILRESSRRVNRHNRRRGHLWSRRYDDQVILTEEDLLEAYLYVTTNAVKHGLVRDMYQWPGLSSYAQVQDGIPRSYPFVHYSREAEAGGYFKTEHTLTLTPLPQHAGLDPVERVQEVRRLLQGRTRALVEERVSHGGGFLGKRALVRQPAGRKPVKVSYRARPVCYTMNREVREGYRAERSLFRQYYCEASEQFRSGDLTVEFPPFCFKPPLHHHPSRRLAA